MNAETGLPPAVSALFGKGKACRLRDLGHDILEGKREGCRLVASSGKPYLDLTSSAGIYNLGRREPDLARALKEALQETDQGNFPMISREKAELAERLTRFVPAAVDCAVFGVTRGETVDFACKLARGHTGRTELVHLEGAFHGETGFALSLSDLPGKNRYGPLLPRVRRLRFADASAAASSIGPATAALFIESVQAENGCRSLTPERAQALADLCRREGALLVVDETQTGFGRTGTPFGFQQLGVEPDIVILGEALGGGLFPIAATLFRQELNGFLNAHPMIHLSTFGGSDLGCRVAVKAVEKYQATRPWDNAAEKGQELLSACQDLPLKGRGLLLALELPSPEEAVLFCSSCAEKGLLVLPGKVARHTVVLRPPLLLAEDGLQQIVDALKALRS